VKALAPKVSAKKKQTLLTKAKKLPASTKKAFSYVWTRLQRGGRKVALLYRRDGKWQTRNIVITGALLAALAGGAYYVRKHKGRVALKKKE